MKRLLIFATFVVFVSVFLHAETPPSNINAAAQHTLTPLMHMKLDRAKAILEGLTLEDYGKIESSARSLRLLSLESGWNVIQTQEYDAQSLDFRRAADMIVEAAKAKDIHRASLGYVGLTVRCVECHSYMRSHRVELMNLKTD